MNIETKVRGLKGSFLHVEKGGIYHGSFYDWRKVWLGGGDYRRG